MTEWNSLFRMKQRCYEKVTWIVADMKLSVDFTNFFTWYLCHYLNNFGLILTISCFWFLFLCPHFLRMCESLFSNENIGFELLLLRHCNSCASRNLPHSSLLILLFNNYSQAFDNCLEKPEMFHCLRLGIAQPTHWNAQCTYFLTYLLHSEIYNLLERNLSLVAGCCFVHLQNREPNNILFPCSRV